jgi:hypothetical protein
MKVPVIEDSDFNLYLEYHNGNTFIHCDVFTRYTKAIRLRLTENLEFLIKQRKSPLYALHDLDDLKHQKFLESMKFNFLQNVIGTDGTERGIYIREVQ